ncbi:MAG: hypothetical protein WC511_03395 [Candidatus Pacearchaeota archaeon]
MFRLVELETPYKGKDYSELEINIKYARKCMRDCLLRGESPFASHLLYTQENVLNDKIPDERKLGIEAGLAWASKAEATVVYTDRGISEGMKLAIERAEKEGRLVEYRTLSKKDSVSN